MSGVKISDLPAASGLAAGQLIEVSTPAGPSSYTSQRIDVIELLDRTNHTGLSPLTGVAGTLPSTTLADDLAALYALAAATPTLEQVRAENNEIAGPIISPNGVTVNLDDTNPGVNSFSVTATDGTDTGQLYVNRGQVYAGDQAQNTGLYVNIGSEDLGLFNQNGAFTLMADGNTDNGNKQLKSLAPGTDESDAATFNQAGRLLRPTSATFTNNTTTPSDVPGLSFTLAANSTYQIEGRFRIGCDNTGGVRIGVSAPGTSTVYASLRGFTTGTSTYVDQGIFAPNTTTGSTYCRINNTHCLVYFKCDIITAIGGGGTFTIQIAAGVAGQTATIFQQPSSLLLRRL